MKIITYTLHAKSNDSDEYYKTIALFAKTFIRRANIAFKPLVEQFQVNANIIQQSTLPEHYFELLTLGVLLRIYGDRASSYSHLAEYIFQLLNFIGKKTKSLKFLVKRARALMFFTFDRFEDKQSNAFSLYDLRKLVNWLTAVGDLHEEAKKMTAWLKFLEKQNQGIAETNLKKIVEFAVEFEKWAETTLGDYTPNVESFLATTCDYYRNREDKIFCERRRVEYHLNMLGNEILNQAYRSDFLKTKRKIVILPPCMRAHLYGECRSIPTQYGAHCASCTPGCRINQITKMGEEYGFGVFITPEELRTFSRSTMQRQVSVGVVGVSCVLTNAPGGWETKAMGVPAQGVLLDYCGCFHHWDRKGFQTDINLKKLIDILNL